jgi:hypothetical protein
VRAVPPNELDAPEQGKDEPPCALGNICIGPVISGGLPNLIGFGVQVHTGDWLSFGLDYQFLPSFDIDGVDSGASLFSIDARLHPFAGTFFLGTGLGFQHADFDMGTVKGAIDSTMIKLALGWIGRDGFVIGTDLAAGIPLNGIDVEYSYSTPSTGNPVIDAANQMAEDQIQNAADVLAGLPFLFQVNLIRIGYLF